jgi:hypothetical protein
MHTLQLNKVHPHESSEKQNVLIDKHTASSIPVKTFRDEIQIAKEVDVSILSSSELSNLKSQDPFMWCSIPQVRTAEMSGDDIDTVSLASSIKTKCTAPITRSRRISTECHPGHLLQADFLKDLDSVKTLEVDFQAGGVTDMDEELNGWDVDMLDAYKALFDE